MSTLTEIERAIATLPAGQVDQLAAWLEKQRRPQPAWPVPPPNVERAELEAWLESVEAACVVLAADGTTARHYAELRRALDATREEAPCHDLWIGALALQHNLEWSAATRISTRCRACGASAGRRIGSSRRRSAACRRGWRWAAERVVHPAAYLTRPP